MRVLPKRRLPFELPPNTVLFFRQRKVVHYAMQGRSEGRARLSTVGREILGAGGAAAPATRAGAAATTTNHFAKSHLRLTAMVVIRLDGEADFGRPQPKFERVAVGVSEVAASGG